MDWGVGHYEEIAAQLLPIAGVVVGFLAPQPGEHVVDLGCGTGNAALLAAARGAHVTGVDPAPRLVEVAGAEAEARGLDVEFVVGEAQTLAFPEGSIDAIVSVFGVIFAPNAVAAAAEMARRLTPEGRIVLSAWTPGGALADQARLRRQAVAAAVGQAADPGPAQFAWHDRDELTDIFAPHGFSVEVHDEVAVFTAASAREYAEGEWANHPLWVEARTVLEPLGRWQAVCDDVVRLFVDANEDPRGFRISSRYVVATLRRGGEAKAIS